VLAGDPDALGAGLGEAALVEDEDALGAAELVVDASDELAAQGGVVPGGLADEDLGHADLGGVGVDPKGDALGGLVVVVVQQQAAQVGRGAVGARVVAEQGGEAADEVVEQRQGSAEVGGGHGAFRGWRTANVRKERPSIGYKTHLRCLHPFVALYY